METLREIKFRARRVDNHPQCFWAYGLLVKTPLTAEFNATDGSFFDAGGKGRWCIVDNGVAHEIDIKTVGEFTSLKDKNGKDIYEGDIVQEYSGVLGLTKVGSPVSISYYKNGFYLDNGIHSLWDNGSVEVVANIHENSEFI